MKSTAPLYLLVLSILWGGSFLLIQIVGQTVPPLAYATGRMVIGALSLYLFMRLSGKEMPFTRTLWSSFLILGLFNALAPMALLSYAEHQISSGLTSVLNSTVPIMTVILAHFLVDEHLTIDRGAGIAVGFIGTVIVLLPDLAGNLEANLIGPIAVLIASFFMALTAIYARKYLKSISSTVTATGMMAAAALVGLPATLIFEKPAQIRPSTEGIVAWIALGIFCSAIAFLLYYWLIANRGATYASLVMFTQPPVAIIFGAIFIGDVVHWTTILGLGVILLCIAILDGFLDPLFDHSTRKETVESLKRP